MTSLNLKPIILQKENDPSLIAYSLAVTMGGHMWLGGDLDFAGLKFIQTYKRKQFASFFEHTLDPIEILKLVKSKGQFNPSEIDADNVSLYGCIFNVKSTISSEAVTREVITGWDLISKNLSVNGIEIEKLFRPTFFYMIFGLQYII